jgi:uncharacterized membrane protein YtjA (UPF0391 family)
MKAKNQSQSWDAMILKTDRRRSHMLRWAIGFFIIALVAAVLGFGGLAATAAGIAKFIFYIFLVLFMVSLLAHLMRGSRL